MIDVDATTLLKRKLDKNLEGQAYDRDAGVLASILECMPLAIVQAAMYIQQKGSRYSVRQYIEEFRKEQQTED